MKLLLTLLLLIGCCFGQDQPKKVLDLVVPSTDTRFLNKGNIFRLSFAAGGMALDAYSTQRFLSPKIQSEYRIPPHELNPIARPFVQRGWTGQLEASGLSFAATVGGTWLAHKTGHHKLEHAIPLVTGSISWAAGSANMRF